MKCNSTIIYLSTTPLDRGGTMSCFKCGGSEDAAIGIAKDGKRITKYGNASMFKVQDES
jgi:hypothetical protein